MLIDKIKNKETGIVLYGLTPPKKTLRDEKIKAIASRQVKRVEMLDIDGLVLYDLQDEKSRVQEQRPFPYLETLDSYDYCKTYFQSLPISKIIYRAVGKYSVSELSRFLVGAEAQSYLTVFVGSPSSSQKVTMPLNSAYRLKVESGSELLLGGVAIPERHLINKNEHIRVFQKVSKGCDFFISQGVFDVVSSKNFLSDYCYYGREHGLPIVPIIFTFTPCGSLKTLKFMKWLGINVPVWLENELNYANNVLEKSISLAEQCWRELKTFADEKAIPIGCNIESVALSKAEIDASVELLHRIAD